MYVNERHSSIHCDILFCIVHYISSGDNTILPVAEPGIFNRVDFGEVGWATIFYITFFSFEFPTAEYCTYDRVGQLSIIVALAHVGPPAPYLWNVVAWLLVSPSFSTELIDPTWVRSIF